jgi:ketosteroid isomerase-like protein
VFVGLDGGTARALGADGAAATETVLRDGHAGVATTSRSRRQVDATQRGEPTRACTRRRRSSGSRARRAHVRPAAAPPARRPPAAPRAARRAPPTAVRGPRERRTSDLAQAARQWLDAYQRRDRDTLSAMGTEGVTILRRALGHRTFTAWQGSVQRNLDEEALELTGDVAVFTARMTSTRNPGLASTFRACLSSGQRRGGRWYVTNVRIIGELG